MAGGIDTSAADTTTTTTTPHIGGEDTSNGNSNNNHNNTDTSGNSSKKRKADRWKHINKAKKEKQRASIEKNNRRKQIYDDRDTPMIPHEGSFAHEKMRQLFNVSIGDDSGDDHADGKKPTASTSNESGTASTAKVGDDDENDNNNNNTIAKLPKRKLAILVSFLGTDYSGFQINPSHRTLQAELELALYKAGIISKHNFGFPNKYSWSNSARTDKGVHAAAQVCSFKGEMIFHNPSNDDDDENNKDGRTGINDEGDGIVSAQKLKIELDAMRNKVNEYLPSEVRVLDIARPTRMFCARTNRNKVRYQYMVPSYMFCSREEVRRAFFVMPSEGGDNNHNIVHNDTTTILPEILAQARNRLMNYRVTPDQLERLHRGLKLFEGTHCFHNYTRRIGANDASSNRYILSFVPLDPILVPSTTMKEEEMCDTTITQWIPLQVVGQSFLLNQIRKMVSAAVDFARGAVSEEAILQSLTKECRVKVNVAPAQGLFLDRSYYEFYNRQKVKSAPKTEKNNTTNAGSRMQQQQHDTTLEWAEADGQEELPPAGKSKHVHFTLFSLPTSIVVIIISKKLLELRSLRMRRSYRTLSKKNRRRVIL